MITEAEIGGMCIQVKECQQLLEAGRGKGRLSPRVSRGNVALTKFLFQTSGFQNHERINLSFKTLLCGNFFPPIFFTYTLSLYNPINTQSFGMPVHEQLKNCNSSPGFFPDLQEPMGQRILFL